MANNQRFLILPGVSVKNLTSRVLALNCRRLSADWEAVYGHPLLMVETFVDHSRFAGTCYRAAGWIPVGRTSGYGRKNGVYYYHGQTKTVFIKPLVKKASAILSAPFLPPELTGGERAMVDLNKVALETKGGLLDYLALVKDPRKRRGIRHAQISILAIAICAFKTHMDMVMRPRTGMADQVPILSGSGVMSMEVVFPATMHQAARWRFEAARGPAAKGAQLPELKMEQYLVGGKMYMKMTDPATGKAGWMRLPWHVYCRPEPAVLEIHGTSLFTLQTGGGRNLPGCSKSRG